ncbi:MAG: flagellar M-ring protein FliF C-terminal domain-containing protein [Vampirovibrionales bacterium]|nr:flagellar M-ring protein FliF C-terminal domain-containing protein [Vampirovibrionales bacterium]
MPPWLQEFIQNRRLLAIVGGSLALVILVGGYFAFTSSQNADPDQQKLTSEQRVLATVDSLGKAIEIQALLAREGLRADRKDADGGKATVLLEEGSTKSDMDQALITLVQSGLMDKNVGLEAFDKGDITASREEKRIKLIRAQQGELARLIRKIPPIEEASVSLSIPDPSIFRQNQQAVSASVQVTVPVGRRLERDQVKSIINLMVGSIQGLGAEHVALSDTNGNTYNSVINGGLDTQDKLEEQDQYMKQKVASQLDRLVGVGHYVVTVSTFLREAPEEVYTERYDPEQAAIVSRQQFSEKLNAAGSKGAGGASGPVDVALPKAVKDMAAAVASNNQSSESNKRGYERGGVEESYATSKTATVTRNMPGMIEEVSIAVTLDSDKVASMGMTEESLKDLLARAASPKVKADNVSIVRVPFSSPAPYSAAKIDDEAEGWPAWATWAVAALVIAITSAVLIRLLLPSRPESSAMESELLAQTQQEIAALKAFSQQQQQQLQAQQQQTQAMLNQTQQAQQAALLAQQQQMAALPGASAASSADFDALNNTMRELQTLLASQNADGDLDESTMAQLPVQQWLES